MQTATISIEHGIAVVTATIKIESNYFDKSTTELTLCKDNKGNFVWGFPDKTAETGMAIETTVPVTEEQLQFVEMATRYARNTWTLDLAVEIYLPF